MKVTGKREKKHITHMEEEVGEIDDAKRELNRLSPSMLILEIG